MAKDKGASYLLFVDPDMEPDIEEGRADGKALPFFQSSLNMLEKLKAGKIEGMPEGSLGIIGAPALSGPPDFMVNVQMPDDDVKCKYRRATIEEAIAKTSMIERVVAIGTGLMLIPMAVFDKAKTPYFEDKYNDPLKRFVYSSQDTSFCFNCNNNGVSVWCNWYAWARHWKTCPIDRPTPELLNFLRADLTKHGRGPICQNQKSHAQEMEDAAVKRRSPQLSDAASPP